MRALIEFIDRVYLAGQSPSAQVFLLDALIRVLSQKRCELQNRRETEDIIARLESGEVENPGDHSAQEIAEAIEVIRNSCGHAAIDYDWTKSMRNRFRASTQS